MYSFGTVESGTVSFEIVADGWGIDDWSLPMNIVKTSIPGASPPITEVEVVLTGPSVVTWRLHLDSRADYQALRAKLGTVDTLSIARDLQSHDGAESTVDGVVHVTLPYTLLDGLGRDTEFALAGWVEVDATFLRQLDPATGSAVPL